MKTYPLKSLNLSQAMELQFKLVDVISEHFKETNFLTLGDLGVVNGINQPQTTQKVEKILATFFQTESAILVRGAGTGALRYALHSVINENSTILIHHAPIYPTTKTTLEMLKAKIIEVNFNNLQEVQNVLASTKIDVVLIQHTRQNHDDSYEYCELIEYIKTNSNAQIVTDDNYAVLKVQKIGAQFSRAISTFSSFKLLGPEGIGVIIGSHQQIKKIKLMNYSGGCQVQGHEALEVIRGMVYAPVSLAIQAQEVELAVQKINKLQNNLIKKAFVANAQSKVIIVEFTKPISHLVLESAVKNGAAANPVGAESKYELIPMFYKVSNTFIKSNPSTKDFMIRINPMRASHQTVIKILQKGLNDVSK